MSWKGIIKNGKRGIMAFAPLLDYLQYMRSEITEKLAFASIEKYGPRNDMELQQLGFRYSQLLISDFLAVVHAALVVGILLLTGYGIELADRRLPESVSRFIDWAGVLVFVFMLYYIAYGAAFQMKFLLRGMDLLSIYRKICFLEGYPLYFLAGMVFGVVLAFLLSPEPGVLLADYENSQKTNAIIFGGTALVASFSSILRVYLLEAQNRSIVLDWLVKWEELRYTAYYKN